MEYTITEKDILFNMYSEYMKELWAFSDYNEEERLHEWFDNLYNDPDIDFLKVKDGIDGDMLIGFLVVKNLDEKHKKELGIEKYICEAYIKPEYRNKGYMAEIVKDKYVKENIPVAMHIYKKNEKAKIFWSEMFMRNQYTYEHIWARDKDTSHGKNCEFIRFVKVS